MKKVFLLSLAGLLSFVLSTAGIYLAMPSIAPAVVQETNVRLDSLGLVPLIPADSLTIDQSLDTLRDGDSIRIPIGSEPDSIALVPSDSLVIAATREGDPLLLDSLNSTIDLVHNLRRDNAALKKLLDDVSERLDSIQARHIEAADLGKSLSKLEDKQLAGILMSLDLDVIEMLYLQASPRERSRLLQHLHPDQAARFVRTLVGSNAPADAATDPLPDTVEDPSSL